jgi:hypothetical protein
MQSGIADMWASSAVMTLERHNDFLFTTPYAIQKYGAIMKRQSMFELEFNHVTVGIDLLTYAILCMIFILICIVSAVNERWQMDRNTY